MIVEAIARIYKLPYEPSRWGDFCGIIERFVVATGGMLPGTMLKILHVMGVEPELVSVKEENRFDFLRNVFVMRKTVILLVAMGPGHWVWVREQARRHDGMCLYDPSVKNKAEIVPTPQSGNRLMTMGNTLGWWYTTFFMRNIARVKGKHLAIVLNKPEPTG